MEFATYTLLPKSKAQEIAQANTLAEECVNPWTYTVAPRGEYFVVEVRDEKGILLGAL